MQSGLTGVRVLDLGMFLAGPYCGKLLADMGAQVIKIESAHHPDPLRENARGIFPNADPGERPWNRSGMINDRNRGKLGITLDLAHPEGRRTFLQLVAISDVVLENFRVGAMDNLGLGYEELRRINPNIVLASLTSQGSTGPERSYRSYGPVIAQLSGLMSITGYPDDDRPVLPIAIPDCLASFLAVGLIGSALLWRRRSGEGVHIDLSQRETTSSAIGEYLMDYSINGREPGVEGNARPPSAPCGVFRCSGPNDWIAIAVRSSAEWKGFCHAIDRDDLKDHPNYATPQMRWTHREELKELIEGWTSDQEKYQAMRRFQAAGVPSGVVANSRDLYGDPQLAARGLFEMSHHPEAGTHTYPGRPWKMVHTAHTVPGPAPCLGEHNNYVYQELLGLSDPYLADLREVGTIASEPGRGQDRMPS